MNKAEKICLLFYIFLVIFWFTIFLDGTKDDFNNYLYSFLFGLIPLVGGFMAIIGSRSWGGMKSAVGKAVLFIGLGMFFWGSGETIWSYYNFFVGEPAPYPSLADLGFAPSVFFYSLGTIFLAKATGAKFGLKNKLAKYFVSIAPLVIFIFSYYILVEIARGGVLVPPGETPLKIILDIVYPLGNFVGLTVGIIVSGLSFKYLGGKYASDVYAILVGLAVMFIADTTFSYTTTVGTFYNASYGDLLLTTGLFLMTFGLLGFYVPKQID